MRNKKKLLWLCRVESKNFLAPHLSEVFHCAWCHLVNGLTGISVVFDKIECLQSIPKEEGCVYLKRDQEHFNALHSLPSGIEITIAECLLNFHPTFTISSRPLHLLPQVNDTTILVYVYNYLWLGIFKIQEVQGIMRPKMHTPIKKTQSLSRYIFVVSLLTIDIS